ncbi:MAG: hypothetical protein DRG50_08515 [Deltaproteobacteria bacterium]|nr:MAG: hypothetical protein DRG50_08515 [Deltaproteobacteria bacterium]
MSSRSRLLVLTFLMEGAVLIAALVLAGLCEIALLPLTENLLHDILIGTYGALFPLALFVLVLSKRAEAIPLLRSARKALITEIKTIFSTAGLIDICLISLFAGFAEELLFRGVIQVKLGIVAASIMFGLLHCITPVYVVVATIIGFYIGILYYLYQSLLIPIQLHFIYDFGALIYLRYFVSK